MDDIDNQFLKEIKTASNTGPDSTPYFISRTNINFPNPSFINADGTSTSFNSASEACVNTCTHAFLEALHEGASLVEPEHLLIGFMHGTSIGNIANRLLRTACLDQNGKERNIFELSRLCLSASPDRNLHRQDSLQSTIERLSLSGAVMEAFIVGQQYSKAQGKAVLQSRHLLLALLEANNADIDTILGALSVDKEQLLEQLRDNNEFDAQPIALTHCNPYDDFSMMLAAQTALSRSERDKNFQYILLEFSLPFHSKQQEIINYTTKLNISNVGPCALNQAKKAGSAKIECEHLLMGIAMHYCRAVDLLIGVHPGNLSDFANDFNKARKYLRSLNDEPSHPGRGASRDYIPPSEDTCYVLIKATALAYLEDCPTAESKHVLAALMILNRRRVNQVLSVMRISKHDILQALPACSTTERVGFEVVWNSAYSFVGAMVAGLTGFSLLPTAADRYRKYRTLTPNDVNDFNESDILMRPRLESDKASDDTTGIGADSANKNSANSGKRSSDPAPASNKGYFKRVASLAVLGAVVLKGKTAALIGVKLLSLAKLGWVVSKTWTIGISFALYCGVWGWKFAAALIVLLYIHELGHFIFMWMKGLKPNAPVFVPFLGAYVAMNEMPQDKMTHALVAFAGPFVGGLGAVLFLIVGWLTHNDFLIASAIYGFILNLLQLMPMKPFDGGFIVEGVSKWILVPGVVLAFGAAYVLQSVFMLVLGVIGLLRTIRAFRGETLDTVQDTSRSQKIILGVMYLGLALGLAAMISVSSWAIDDKTQLLFDNITNVKDTTK